MTPGSLYTQSLSCESWIPVIRPFLSECLVTGPALVRLGQLAGYLPSDCLGALEVRLASGCDTVDFSVRVAEPAQARWLAQRVGLPHVSTLLSRWSSSDSELSPASSVWLEFDLDREVRELPVPVLCARLRSPFDARWLIDSLLPAMHGRPLSEAQKHRLQAAIEAIPGGGKVLYAFSLLSRPGNAIRLELFGLGPEAMVDYLRRVLSSQAADQVADIADLVADGDRYHLSFDIDDDFGPRIGVEVGYQRLPHREPRWGKLFDRLVRHGLCASDKRAAVFTWPGYDTPKTAAERWPGGAHLAADPVTGFCVRCLSHVKLVTWPHREPEAKAYLLFQHLHRSGQQRLAAAG